MSTTQGKRNKSKREWLVVAGLLLLAFIPMLAGTARLAQLGGGAEITPDNARFFASPIPVITHIVGAIIYSTVGAFQFTRSHRHWRKGLHKTVGQLLVITGLAVSLSGLWMTQFYPWPEGDGMILYAMRLVVGISMTTSLVLGYFSARGRNYAAHSDWMIRAYALGMGAGTQVLTHIPYFIFADAPAEIPRAIAMGAGWLINILVAEWIIYNRWGLPKRRKSPTGAAPVA